MGIGGLGNKPRRTTVVGYIAGPSHFLLGVEGGKSMSWAALGFGTALKVARDGDGDGKGDCECDGR